MTTAIASRQTGRSVGAVAAGFVATAVLSMATDGVMHATGVFPGWGEPMADGLFAWATIYRGAYTVFGGYLTAALAPARPMRHAMILAAIGTALAAIGAAVTWNAGPAFGPHWYPLMLVITAVPCVWAGGALWMRLRGAR